MKIETRFDLDQHIYYVGLGVDGRIDGEGIIERIDVSVGDELVDGEIIFYHVEGGGKHTQEFCFATKEERDMWWKEAAKDYGIDDEPREIAEMKEKG